MADICEICMKPLDRWVDGAPNYEDYGNEIILCRKCDEEVDELCDGDNEKMRRAVEKLRKKMWKNK